MTPADNPTLTAALADLPTNSGGMLTRLEPGEPWFGLRGNDETAATVVNFWIERNHARIDPKKLEAALGVLRALEQWAETHATKTPD